MYFHDKWKRLSYLTICEKYNNIEYSRCLEIALRSWMRLEDKDNVCADIASR